MAVLMADDFTGTVGQPWDPAKWALGLDPVSPGGGAVIDTNTTGRLATGNAGGYSGDDKISRRFNITTQADLEIRLDFHVGGEMYPGLFFRSSDPGENGVGSYTVSLHDAPALLHVSGYSATVLAAATTGVSTGAWYSLHLHCIGSTIQARFWPRGTPEPGSWNIANVTDTAITTAGHAGVITGNGGAALSQWLHLDKVEVTDGAATLGPIRTRVNGSWATRRVRVAGSWVDA